MNKIKDFTLEKIPLYKILLAFVLLYFLIFGFLMLQTLGQPDQGYHNFYSSRFSETWSIPTEDPSSPFVFTGMPYLAYWINGTAAKIYNFVFPSGGPIDLNTLWRAISVLTSMGTVYFLYKFTAKITNNPIAGVIGAFFLSNTLMFVFVSGGVSYDNLMNLGSMAALYHLLNILKKEDFIKNTAMTGIWLCVASLTKEQSLLLSFIIFLVILIFFIRNFKVINYRGNIKNFILIIFLIIFLGLFLNLYGENLISYGTTTPACEQIKPAEACTRFDFRKDMENPYDLRWIWYARNSFSNNPILYTISFWILQMVKSIWGIASHSSFIPMFTVALHTCLLFWWLLCMARYWKKKDRISSIFFVIMITYSLYIFLLNYKSELLYDFKHIALQGRYLFPVIGILITLMIKYFLKIRSMFIKRMTFSLAIIIYFTGGLGVYIFRFSEIFIHWQNSIW